MWKNNDFIDNFVCFLIFNIFITIVILAFNYSYQQNNKQATIISGDKEIHQNDYACLNQLYLQDEVQKNQVMMLKLREALEDDQITHKEFADIIKESHNDYKNKLKLLLKS